MHAFVMWANECLGHLAYEAVAPAIAMASLMVVFTIDFLTARYLSKRNRGSASGSPYSSTTEEGQHTPDGKYTEALGHDHTFENAALPQDGADKRAHWDVHLLEAGIVFHSIMIGVTLGAQGGSGFVRSDKESENYKDHADIWMNRFLLSAPSCSTSSLKVWALVRVLVCSNTPMVDLGKDG